ncbi:MAG TPA: hypothetical protein PKV67_03785 [Hyphomonas sp.]|nr:hypothetical protein [Hyphomonas sp.]HRI99871.1 hypothetical protein [Hyphomonas sp.]HRK67729.1 hypothetical protein [Hyphomonas sp.]
MYEFVGESNKIELVAEDRQVLLPNGERYRLPEGGGGIIAIYFRPHDIRIMSKNESGIRADVESVRRIGASVRTQVSASFGKFEADLPLDANIKAGDRLSIAIARFKLFVGTDKICSEGGIVGATGVKAPKSGA